VAPHPENPYELAEAQSRAGLTAEAARSYAQFEQGARGDHQGADAKAAMAARWPAGRRRKSPGASLDALARVRASRRRLC